MTATQNAHAWSVEICATCQQPYSPAMRPTGGAAQCSLCGIKRDLAIAETVERLEGMR